MKNILLILIGILVFQCNLKKKSGYTNSDFEKIEIAFNHIKEIEGDTSVFVIYDSIVDGNSYDVSKSKFELNSFEKKKIYLNERLNNNNSDGNKIMRFSQVSNNHLLIEVVNINMDMAQRFKTYHQFKYYPKEIIYPFHKIFLKNPYRTYLFKFQHDNTFDLTTEKTFYCQ